MAARDDGMVMVVLGVGALVGAGLYLGQKLLGQESPPPDDGGDDDGGGDGNQWAVWQVTGSPNLQVVTTV